MALARSHTMAIDGVSAHAVTVEAHIGPGLPGMHVVGLGDTAVRESRDRIRTAAANTELNWPRTKIMVSLAPADLPKTGSHFDLPIALAVLAAHHPVAARNLEHTMVVGELGLDGSVRAVPGIIPALLTARRDSRVTQVLIPRDNYAEAALAAFDGLRIVSTLAEAWAWVCGVGELESVDKHCPQPNTHTLDFADVVGQHEAKIAAEVAAAGGHHMLLIGPPGAGKSMIAERLPSIMPTLNTQQALETTAVHSVTGALEAAILTPPFIAPHHSVSRPALVGGGSGRPRPGAVSLAHNGVLFLDEVSEIPTRVLDGLRIPLEHGRVKVIRSRREVTFPARFQLVLAANPCHCGAEEPSACVCTSSQRARHLSNLSGPLRDRLDLAVTVGLGGATILSGHEESSATIARRVQTAQAIARRRWHSRGLPAQLNGHIPGPTLRKHGLVDEAALALISAYLAKGELTQRGVDKTLRLAWTLCDVEAARRLIDSNEPPSEEALPNIDHVARALELRIGIEGREEL